MGTPDRGKVADKEGILALSLAFFEVNVGQLLVHDLLNRLVVNEFRHRRRDQRRHRLSSSQGWSAFERQWSDAGHLHVGAAWLENRLGSGHRFFLLFERKRRSLVGRANC